MADLLPKRYRKALRGELDVKSRKAPAPLTTIPNPDIPKWDYKTGRYTRTLDEQESYMKEKAQKKADKKFKEEAGFGDYALELGGYGSAAYLYFKLPKIADHARKGVQGLSNLAFKRLDKKFGQGGINLKTFDYKGTKTQRMWHVDRLVNKQKPSIVNSWELRSLLTGKDADKIQKDIISRVKMSDKEVKKFGGQTQFWKKGASETSKALDKAKTHPWGPKATAVRRKVFTHGYPIKQAHYAGSTPSENYVTDRPANLSRATATERQFLYEKQRRNMLSDVYEGQPKSWSKEGDPLERKTGKRGIKQYHKEYSEHMHKLQRKGQWQLESGNKYLKNIDKIQTEKLRKKKINIEVPSKGKTILLKKQNYGTGNISKGNVVDPSISNINEKLRNVSMKKGRLSEPTGGKLPQFQTKSKQSLLTKQSVKSRGGGKSAGGGGGKFSIINRSLSGRSPWHHLKRLLQ